jgi:excisionase family DNA binding protein
MENLIGPEEASQALGIEVSTLYNWVHRRRIPFVKVGSALRFKPSALEGWLREREYSPAPKLTEARAE